MLSSQVLFIAARRSAPSFTAPVRSIFSSEFLALDIYKAKRQSRLDALLTRGQPEDAAHLSRQQILRKGVSLLDASDVDTLIDLSYAEPLADQACDIIQQFVLAGSASFSEYRIVLRNFTQLCHCLNYYRPLRDLLSDDRFLHAVGFIDSESGRCGTLIPATLTCYLDLLYENKMYDEVIAEVKRFHDMDSNLHWTLSTLAMMSCMRLSSDRGWQEACSFFSEHIHSKDKARSSILHPYVWIMAIQQCQHEPALKLLMEHTLIGKNSFGLRNDIKLFILCQMKRLNESTTLLERMISHHSKLGQDEKLRTPSLSLQTVEALTTLAQDTEDRVMKRRVAESFQELDKIGRIDYRSLSDQILRQIDTPSSMKNRREKNRKRHDQRSACLSS